MTAVTEVPAGTIWLGGRFRLDERVSTSGSQVSVWKATDGLLCRPVTIHLLPHGVRVPARVVAAVQAAARVSDPRLATIYDTDYDIEGPYVVSEWTPGTHLEDLVLSGLPSPALAAAMIADAADALAVAHRAGLAHLCLSPRSLRWDTGSGLKITGLGIDAAMSSGVLSSGVLSSEVLSSVSAADGAAADTRALGGMLYALLTGFWPGDEPTALPAAPRHKERVYTPRQVRAGVPGVLDAITCHALQLQPVAGAAPSPAGLAAALRSVQRPSKAPFRASLGPALGPALGPLEAVGRYEVPAQDPAARRRARHARIRAGVRHRTMLHPAA